jgi:acetolactate decarboxylase
VTRTSPRAPHVAWVGAQRNVLAGDLRPVVSLAELQRFEHLYALGPLERLRGEISVFDGVPLIARVREGTVAVAAEGGAGACFLVYADVVSWRWTTMPSPLLSGDEESHVLKFAAEYDRHDGRAPLVFLLRGVAATLVAHVLDKRDELPHSPERHEQAKFRFTLHDRDVEVIGFHSAAHRGIFTPADSNIHMHFRTIDGQTSGHVERLDLAPGWALGLPAFELGATTREEETAA